MFGANICPSSLVIAGDSYISPLSIIFVTAAYVFPIRNRSDARPPSALSSSKKGWIFASSKI
jgi:hypothetical protein